MSTELSTPRADMYLKVQSAKQGFIKGDSVVADHKDEIVLTGWYWGLAQNTDAANRSQAIAKRSLRPLVVEKRLDSASTKLMSALSTNEEIKNAVLTMRMATAGQQDYMTITLQEAAVIDVQCNADPSGHVHERVTIGFAKIDVSYRPTLSNGVLGAAVTFSDQLV